MGKVVGGTVAAFVALVLIIGGGWKLHWWFVQANANNAAHVNRSSYGNQQTLRDEITAHLGVVYRCQWQDRASVCRGERSYRLRPGCLG